MSLKRMAMAWFSRGVCAGRCACTGRYALRLYVITETRKYRQAACGRLRYALTFRALVDAASTLPFFLELFLRGAGPLSAACHSRFGNEGGRGGGEEGRGGLAISVHGHA